ncbi:hypothetical protein BA011_26465 (plasmid) [Rhizobium leguminosarum]|uniref:Uncharacterized protein n=1 Tax=Rhizobium leguminosarum TaxID=384 RepID=A0A1B1CHW4_RHILE|nr:hypothetical protein BA011_26465 [Rhizobium leguminosarum]
MDIEAGGSSCCDERVRPSSWFLFGRFPHPEFPPPAFRSIKVNAAREQGACSRCANDFNRFELWNIGPFAIADVLSAIRIDTGNEIIPGIIRNEKN